MNVCPVYPSMLKIGDFLVKDKSKRFKNNFNYGRSLCHNRTNIRKNWETFLCLVNLSKKSLWQETTITWHLKSPRKSGLMIKRKRRNSGLSNKRYRQIVETPLLVISIKWNQKERYKKALKNDFKKDILFALKRASFWCKKSLFFIRNR